MIRSMSGRSKPGEEWIDAYVNRPLAAIIVKAVLHTPITPNGLTFIGMGIGSAAGVCFALGRMPMLCLGAALLFVTMILDCADGQLARARGGGSRTGRILDGVADYVVGISIHVGLALALIRLTDVAPETVWGLTIAAMLSTGVQCFLLDHYKTRGQDNGAPDELQAAQEELARAGAWSDRILLPIYIWYTQTQRALAGIGRTWKEVPEHREPASPGLLRKLAFVGPSTHNLLILVAACTLWIAPYFVAVIVLGNFYLVWALGSSER